MDSRKAGEHLAGLVKRSFLENFVLNRVGSPLGFVDNWAQTTALPGIKNKFSKDNIKKELGDASASVFNSNNIGDITRKVVQGEDPKKIMANYGTKSVGNPHQDKFNSILSDNIGSSFTKAITQSDKLSLPTSLAMGGVDNLVNRAGDFIGSSINSIGKYLGGAVAGASDHVKGWGEDIFGLDEFNKESSDNITNLANTVSKPFTPDSPAMDEAGDDVASMVEETVQKEVKNNLNNWGQAGFHAFGGNFGKAFDSISGNNTTVQGQ